VRLLPLTDVLAAGSPSAATRIRGIGSARTGGWVGEAIPGRVTRQFPAPALESVVKPVNPANRGRLFSALRELAEADPLINLRVNEERGEIAVSLCGEVQKEVIADLLARQFGVAVTFRPTVTLHIERIAGTGASSALISQKATPYLATLGFRVEPTPGGSGLACDLKVERGSMPPAFFAATWEGVRAGLAQACPAGRSPMPAWCSRTRATTPGRALCTRSSTRTSPPSARTSATWRRCGTGKAPRRRCAGWPSAVRLPPSLE